MHTFLLVIGLSVVITALALVGLSFNILFLKKKFPNSSVGKNPKLRELGLRCEKCDELKRCTPQIKKARKKQDERLKKIDDMLDFSKL